MKTFVPTNYQIEFDIDLENSKFYGKEKITVNVRQSTDVIKLNSDDLVINDCKVFAKEQSLKPVFTTDEKNEELVLKLPKKVSGKVELTISFRGDLKDQLVGLYRSQYQTPVGKKYLVTTQFEPTDARKAFPCWDNPGDKATFDISVIFDRTLSTISNTEILEEKELPRNKKQVRFALTPVMSTYLVYLGVGEFEFLEDKLGSVQLRIATTPGKMKQGKLAMEFLKKFLRFYENYFGIKYPLKKLDMIALPDFASGAMENWGAITFRETALLYDPEKSTAATKQRIAEVVSHELAHQWFGNLVTMKWWNDLWLNESFATFMGNKTVAHFYPEWDMENQFLNSYEEGLELDSLKSSHPIEVEVKTPSEINEIFDEISYEKGGSILKMLENFLGEDYFRNGLRNYLRMHRYANADTDDFWSSFEKASKKPVKKMMNGWIKQTGYPLIEAKAKDSKLILTQKRFLLQRKSDDSSWLVPISIKVDGRTIKHLLSKKEESMKFNFSNWFKLNYGQNGFFRVRYEDENLQKLKDLVSKKKLDVKDRRGIHNDLAALSMAGHVSLKDYFDFLDAYEDEEDYIVESDILGKLYYIFLLTSDEKSWNKVTDHNKKFLAPLFKKVGWEPRKNEKHTVKFLRSSTILNLGRYGDEEVLGKSIKKFDQFLKKPDSLSPDLRGAVYGCVAWNGNKKVYETILNLYLKEENQEEKRRFLVALCGFKEKELLNRTLEFALTPEVRAQEIFIPPMAVSINPFGKNLVWPWIKNNWTQIKGKTGEAKNMLSRIVENVSTSTQKDLDKEIKAFFDQNPTPEIQRSLDQTFEKMSINSKFLESIRKIF
ncbi:MAG: M1 family metallopeptidase [Candidatus Aenigmarchaeota archaeon]|nr:M1 family metallopeptidase [Candidatus Aenigmarchaeota archaeon]